MKALYLLHLIMLIGLINANKETCKAFSASVPDNGTIYYSCDFNNILQVKLRWANAGGAIFTCKNESWTAQPVQSNSNESCMALSVQKHLCIPIFYSCDSNNNLRANLIFATNLTHSITTIQMCDNGVWIATDQTPSNATPATKLTSSFAQGQRQQDSAVTKVKPAVILMTISSLLSFLYH